MEMGESATEGSERVHGSEALGDWPQGVQMDDLFVDWESLDMTNWDGFPFLT
jgi:hypothetical protein